MFGYVIYPLKNYSQWTVDSVENIASLTKELDPRKPTKPEILNSSYDAFPPYRVDEPGVHNWSWDARHFLRVGCFTHHQPTRGSWSTTFCNFSKAKQESKGSKPLDRRVIIEEWSLDSLGWISRYPQLGGGFEQLVMFSPNCGEKMNPIWTDIYKMG